MATTDNIRIRQTSDPSDFGVCARMMSETDPWITLGMGIAECREAFPGSFREVHVIELDNEIAGFVVLQTSGTFAGYIQTICVDNKFRGKGLGTRLLTYCENRILQYSPNIFICVSSFNKGAYKLYLDFGFKYIGELENFVKQGFTEILLRKTVGPRAGYKPAQNA